MRTFFPAPIFLAAALVTVLAPTNSDAAPVHRISLHKTGSNVCRTFPCPNWTGVDETTGTVFVFDGIDLQALALQPKAAARLEERAMRDDLLVEGVFTPEQNRLGIVWSSRFAPTRLLGFEPHRNRSAGPR